MNRSRRLGWPRLIALLGLALNVPWDAANAAAPTAAPPAPAGAPAKSAPAPAPAKSAPAPPPTPTPAPSATPAPGRAAPAPAQRLPPARTADAILADAVAALGGANAIARHQSVHTKMQITFKGLGITGTAEHYGAVGDKSLTVTSIPNVATTREGSDGKRIWSEDPINGLRILEGAEAEQARIETAWNAELRLKELFAKIEAKNEVTENGAAVECLVLTPKTGAPMTECFDAKTHLMVSQRGVRSSPQGEMPFTAQLSDWKMVGDVKMAHATEMQVGPLSFSGRVTSIEMDTPLDPALFAVPKVSKSGGERAAKKTATPKTDRATAPPASPAPPSKR